MSRFFQLAGKETPCPCGRRDRSSGAVTYSETCCNGCDRATCDWCRVTCKEQTGSCVLCDCLPTCVFCYNGPYGKTLQEVFDAYPPISHDPTDWKEHDPDECELFMKKDNPAAVACDLCIWSNQDGELRDKGDYVPYRVPAWARRMKLIRVLVNLGPRLPSM